MTNFDSRILESGFLSQCSCSENLSRPKSSFSYSEKIESADDIPGFRKVALSFAAPMPDFMAPGQTHITFIPNPCITNEDISTYQRNCLWKREAYAQLHSHAITQTIRMQELISRRKGENISFPKEKLT